MLHASIALAFAALCATDPSIVEIQPGFSGSAFTAANPAAFIGGLAPLPGGHLALFDGARVVEIDPAADGAVLRVLFTPAQFVFGSFLAVDPTDSFVVFGESSFGTLTRIPLDGSPPTSVSTITFNYDGAFDANGVLHVARGNTSFTATDIVRVDLGTGATQVVASLPGPSGPIAFDGSGALLYGENSPTFPAPPGSGNVLAFAATQLANVQTSGPLTDSDALVLATGLNAITDLVVDAEGDLVIADAIFGTLTTYAPTGVIEEVLALPSALGVGITYLAFVDDGATHTASFSGFQPSNGGNLATVVSDFATTNEIVAIQPRRPTLLVAPTNPVPPGPFAVTLEHAPPFGFALYFIAAATSAQEIVVHAGTVPLMFALAPPGIVQLGIVPLDANGAIALPASNPGVGGAIAVQAVVLDATFAPRGTSVALSLRLQ